MVRLLLALSALASLVSAELCFDGREVAEACTAGSDLGPRLMEALDACDYTMRSGEGKDQGWLEVLGLRSLNLTLSPRQDNCHTVQELEDYIRTYAPRK